LTASIDKKLKKRGWQKQDAGETMPSQRYCPKCGALIDKEAAFCSNCGSPIGEQLPTTSPMSRSTLPPSAPQYPPARDMTRRYASLGYISAVVSILFLPEIFGPIAIIIGAYTWRNERSGSNRGLNLLILGIVGMLIGIYFTAVRLVDLIPY